MGGKMKVGRKNKPSIGELDKGNPYQNAFPKPEEEPDEKETTKTNDPDPQIPEPNKETNPEYNQEPNQESNQESNYLEDLLEKKPKIVKRNFEVFDNINKRLDRAAQKYKYGFLKKFINAAIEKELDWLEEQEEKLRKPKNKKT
jgi:molecular chaperone GrpE (heat shock protein)